MTQNQSGATPWEFESPSRHFMYINNKKSIAYIIGVALGDGNLSNSNKRATRLRITCDKKYPQLSRHIISQLSLVFPKNKVSTVNRIGCIDISVHSNDLEGLLGWKALYGSKMKQKVKIPLWIKAHKTYTKLCLLGLFQTDGSIYYDRKYIMVNFTSIIKPLIKDVSELINGLGYRVKARKIIERGRTKYVIRISKNVENFISNIKLWKK